VVVELLLLLLLWSRKELNLGHCKCCTDDEEDIAASQKPLAIALSLAPHNSRASQVDPIKFPLKRSTQMQSLCN
jgi:hypothetical protein